MGRPTEYDYPAIALARAAGHGWDYITRYVAPGANPESLRGSFARWKRNHADEVAPMDPVDGPDEEAPASVTKRLSAEQIQRITNLEDLLQFFKVDLTRYRVRDYRVNTWEQNSAAKGLVPLYQVRANLEPLVNGEELAEIRRELLADMASHAPSVYTTVPRPSFGDGADPALFELAIHDPHLGMLAWGREVGHSYDTNIAVRDYRNAVQYLLSFARLYPTERILYTVGHDTLHVDGPAVTVKGTNRGGATTSGTAQDVDSRRAKVFTAARRAIIEGIDEARTIAPVDVYVVPGNHDENEMYRMGEVLMAWYRNDPEVTVHYGPAKRKFYSYGANAFMLTHGEEYKRQRDSLPLIFATECPAEMWASSTYREIHTGHNHAAMAGRYTPTSELTESRAIRTRSLPGFTPEDAWHYSEGYKHQRAATALVFRKSGGIVGFHEFNL